MGTNHARIGSFGVPAFVWWPGVLEPQEQHILTHMVDWMPTFARVAGYQKALPANLDGYDMLDTLQGEPRPPIYWKTPAGSALRSGDWKLIVLNDASAQLFNLKKNPYEKNNLANQQSERVDDMRRIMEAYAQEDQTYGRE